MRFPRAFPNSLALPSALACALCASACLDSNEPENYFRLEAGPSLQAYSRVAINLDDSAGRHLATLYDDTLASLKTLERLPARSYAGGTARIRIEGYLGPRLAYRERRLYEGRTQRLLDLEIERFADTARNGTGYPEEMARPPFFSSFPSDTAVSIRDTVPLPAEAADPDGDLAAYAWDCGAGANRDSGAIQGPSAKIGYGVRFADPGVRVCRLRVRDLRGRYAEAQVKVNVELDPPWADAGADTTVPAGGVVRLHAGGEDGHGPVVSREWSIGGAPFRAVPQIETEIPAPRQPGEIICILKVTDSDNLTGLDTMRVTVAASAKDPEIPAP